MKKPLIGVVPLWDGEKHSLWMLPGYMDGIAQASGIPLMLPLTADAAVLSELVATLDGFLLTGGQDVTPETYGETDRGRCGEVCEARDKMELVLLEEALAADKPVLGICRGIQLLNAALGGTLYQDIPSEFETNVCHAQKPPYDAPIHGVSVCGRLADMLGTDALRVNSYHHQAVKTLSPRLSACAKAPDGLVEAVYMPDKRFVWAVQWHPEFAPAWESSRRLFAAFADACRK